MAKTPKRNGYIEIKGARENNLKNIDVLIPRSMFTVVTGLSGSGKSSLVLDTVYREGLRRYIDCLSTYARQFIEKVDRPAMDDIEGLPTPIAIESPKQRNKFPFHRRHHNGNIRLHETSVRKNRKNPLPPDAERK